MHPWHDVKPNRVTTKQFLALIEISKGSKNKYELDKETGHLILDRVLFTSTHYPQNYGFIPRTFGEDFDPLDVLVLCSESIVPMSFVDCIPIGVLTMKDAGLNDEKIISVAMNDPFYNVYKDVNELPAHIMQEIRHFFQVYKALEGKETSIDIIGNKEEAEHIIQQGLDRYRNVIAPKVNAERKLRG